MKERKIAKTVMLGKKVICIGLAAVISGGLLAGCAVRGTDAQQTTPSEIMGSVPTDTTPAATTIVETTAVPETTVLETTPVETTVPDTTPVETTILETTPAETAPETTPAETQPPVTTPKATEPEATKPESTTPAHSHSYQATNTVPASCTSQGYTEYACSCGSTVKRDYTSALGHNYTVTEKEATCQQGGCTVHTCERCGKSYEDGHTGKLEHSMEDTTVDGCPVMKCRWCDTQEFTDATLSWLVDYARRYAESQGYVVDIGCRDGYYPGVSDRMRNVAEAKRAVKANVDSQTHQLEAAHGPIWGYIEEDGVIREWHTRFDFAIEPEGGDWYVLWAYYG